MSSQAICLVVKIKLSSDLVTIPLDYYLEDLTSNDDRFSLEVPYWRYGISGAPLNILTVSSKCGSVYLFGGHEVFIGIKQIFGSQYLTIKRTYINLRRHSMVFFKFSVWTIDITPATNLPASYFNGFYLDISTQYYNCFSTTMASNQCGNSALADTNITILGVQQHSASNFILPIVSSSFIFDSSQAIGIRDVRITFSLNSQASTVPCIRSDVPLTMGCADPICSCLEGQYLDSMVLVCKSCHWSCEECFGPGEQDCYSCSQTYGTSYNGTHCIACDTSCATCSFKIPNQCLSCRKGYLLTLDNKCVSTSASPSNFIQTIPKMFCETPNDPTKINYWHTNCQLLCSSRTPQWSTQVDYVTQKCNSCNPSFSSSWSTACVSTCKLIFASPELVATTSATICKGTILF